MFQASITLTGFHIEAGSRRWPEYARHMLDELGPRRAPYLRSWYERARYAPDFMSAGMTAPEELNAALACAPGGACHRTHLLLARESR